MTDDPFLKPMTGIRSYKMDFEVCAVCSKGNDKGMVFGCVQWGHSFIFNGGWSPKLTSWKRYLDRKVWGTSYQFTDDRGNAHGGDLSDPQTDSAVRMKVCDQEPSSTMKGFLDKWLP